MAYVPTTQSTRSGLKICSIVLRALEFVGAILILGYFSSLLTFLGARGRKICPTLIAIESIAVFIVVYTLIALVSICRARRLSRLAVVSIVFDTLVMLMLIAATCMSFIGDPICPAVLETAQMTVDSVHTSSSLSPGLVSCIAQKVGGIILSFAILLFALSTVVDVALATKYRSVDKLEAEN